ncbi:phosphoenolpyruvate-protein phosphotransferase [Muribaculaceae bacterium]|nr:phosphoenolpyruvate-protein phosphotransferase [Muribaculaceae bacterium]
MEERSGKKIFGGIAIGKIKLYGKAENKVVRTKIEDADAEIKRYEEAKAKAIEQLGQLYEKALVEVGEANAEIFNVHSMMLEDDDYNESVHNIISTQNVNAEYAAAVTGDNFAEMFAKKNNPNIFIHQPINIFGHLQNVKNRMNGSKDQHSQQNCNERNKEKGGKDTLFHLLHLPFPIINRNNRSAPHT